MPSPVAFGSVPWASLPCALLGVVLGCALQLYQPHLWPTAHYALLGVGALLAAVALCGRWRVLPSTRAWQGAAWLLVAAAAGWAWAGGRASGLQRTALAAPWEGVDVAVRATLVSLPQAQGRGWRFRARLQPADPDAGALPAGLPPLVQLSWYGAAPQPALRAGQQWHWTVRLQTPHGARNPHGSDSELWQWSQGVQAVGYVRHSGQPGHPQAPVLLQSTRTAWLQQWRGDLHARMQPPAHSSARLQHAYGVVQALVAGTQSSIQPGDWQLFRDTGVAHLVSISGLHITMFAWLAMALLQPLWRRSAWLCMRWPAPSAAAWCGWLLALAYALFSGWGLPAQRTVGMLLLVVALRSSGRRWPWPLVWLLVLAVMVLWSPWSLWQPGFWLSFVAVGILFAAQTQVHLPAPGVLPQPWWRRQARRLQRLWREQWVIGLALAPLTLVLFGQISLLGLVANVLAIPWVTLLVTPLAMLGVLWPWLWELAAWAVLGMGLVLEALAQARAAVLYFAQPPLWAVLLGVLAGLWLALPLPLRWRALLLPAALPLLAWQPATPAWGRLELLALDVGQGSAVLLRTQRHSLLWDAGPQWSAQSNAGERMVVPTLRALGVRLDALVLSHADSDHTGGAEAVLRAQPQLQPTQRWGDQGQPCVAGQQWQWDGVHLELLHPLTARSTGRLGNADSCVLRAVDQHGRSALLTGDLEAAQEALLVQRGTPLQADVVVVPHHGSNTSSSAAFVQAVRPQVALVQAGYRNRFGHPTAAVVQRYAAVGAQVVATPQCGAARWRSEAPAQVACTRQQAPRYWQSRPPALGTAAP